jgi:hypothetical protein
MNGPGDFQVENIPSPKVIEAPDAILRTKDA